MFNSFSLKYSNDGLVLLFKEKRILQQYPEYRKDQSKLIKSKYMISALLNILNINNLLISKNNLVVFRLKRIYDWQSDLK